MLPKHDLKYHREYHRHVVLIISVTVDRKSILQKKIMLNYASSASATKSISIINMKTLFNTELSNTVLILFLKNFRGQTRTRNHELISNKCI